MWRASTTPENKAFVDAYAANTSGCPRGSPSRPTTAGLWTKAAIDSIGGNVEGSRGVSQGDAHGADQGAARAAEARRLRQPDQNVYVAKVEKIKHPVLGDV
jgi:hypothetical protein